MCKTDADYGIRAKNISSVKMTKVIGVILKCFISVGIVLYKPAIRTWSESFKRWWTIGICNWLRLVEEQKVNFMTKNKGHWFLITLNKLSSKRLSTYDLKEHPKNLITYGVIWTSVFNLNTKRIIRLTASWIRCILLKLVLKYISKLKKRWQD